MVRRGISAREIVVAIFAAYMLCEAEATAVGRSYYVGAWSTSPEDKVVAKYSPLLQTYLTEQIGPLYNPPVSFTVVPFFYDSSTNSQAMIDAGKLDFAYALGGVGVCLEAEYQYTLIGTQVDYALGYETSCVGALIVSLKANTHIRNISDFSGKRVGVGYPWALATFSLGAELLDSQGMNIYTKLAQVVFYMTDYAGLANAVLNGEVDVAIVQTGWLEANMPQNIDKLLLHDVIAAKYHSVPYPFPSSTRMVAAFSIAAAPYISATLQQQVSTALRRLNSSHPAAKAAGIARFDLPASYEDARAVVEKLGLMQVSPEGKHCRDLFQGVDSILACPPGYLLKDNISLHTDCDTQNLLCPAGRACFCRPCYLDTSSNVFPWQLVLGMCVGLLLVGVCFRMGWTESLGWLDDSDSDYVPRRKHLQLPGL